MKIVFAVPQLFDSGSTPDEKAEVQQTLNEGILNLVRGSAKTHVVPTLKRTGNTQVTFDLPHVFHVESTPHENAIALQTLLHCLCSIDRIFLMHRMGQVPCLYDSGVIYDRTIVWDSIPALYARGYGDCKSLACARAAEYLVNGYPANIVFRWLHDSKDGVTNYHILVQTPTGFEDPSKVCGMGSDENAYFTNRKTG